jgi:C-terminal processing protease CtpA/Prc
MTNERTAHHAPPITGRRPARLLLTSILGVLALGALLVTRIAFSQELSRLDRENARMMLKITREDLEKYYYDPAYHGLNLDETFGAADAAITGATTHADLFTAIAQPLMALDDSHAFFIPPAWAAKIEFGWAIRMVGDRCYLIAIQPGSDAETKGLKKGDQVLFIDGAAPSRENLSHMLVESRLLAPRGSSLLVVESPGGDSREVIVRTKVTPEKRLWTKSADLDRIVRDLQDQAFLGRHRWRKFGTDLLIWKMPEFDLSRDELGRYLQRVAKYRALILDLRGNPGGSVETLEFMVGGVLGDNVKIGDVNGREKMPPAVSRKPAEVFGGKLIVLIDSDSASAAELFARTMQLNNRAKVIGDRSEGQVMMSRFYLRKVGMKTVMYFGSSITVADIIMTDGKSLEKIGVTPDEIVLPTAADLASGRDPVLAHAASLCGVTIDPDKAGALFPIEWKR